MQQQYGVGVAQLARRWGFTLQHIYNLVRSGRLAAEKRGREWRIPLKAIEDRERQRRQRVSP